MVQEIPSDIPEELYNLTQLAYVSYAAPKLSTETHETKDYLRAHHHHHHHHQRRSRPYEVLAGKRHTLPYYDASAGMINLSPADYYASPLSYPVSLSHGQPTDDGRMVLVQEENSPDALTMAEPTKKKWTKQWEIIQAPAERPRVEVLDVATCTPAHVSPETDAVDSQRASLILYAPTISRAEADRDVSDGRDDKDVQMVTIIGGGEQSVVGSHFQASPPATSPAASPGQDATFGRFGGASASEESQDSAVGECYYSHKLFDRKKARKIRTESCTSSASTVGASTVTTLLLAGDITSQEHVRVEVVDMGELVPEDGLDRSQDATNDSGHVETEPEVSEPEARTSNDESGPGTGFDVHVCPECNKRYSTSSNLARHRQTHRSLEDKKARKCPFCSKVYVSMPAYSMHVRTHNQGCECPTCGKCFSRPWLLQGHIRTHTGEKPFQCAVCNKAFADKSNLRAHVQTHSNTKPHACSRCGKSFALKSYLYKHEDSSCLKNERVPKAPKTPTPTSRTRRKQPKERSSETTVTVSATDGRAPGSASPVPMPATMAHAVAQSAPSDVRPASFPTDVPFKDVVRAKIREVVEDNCSKRTARLLAAAAAAAAAAASTTTTDSGSPAGTDSTTQSQGHSSTPAIAANRISVIRIAGPSTRAGPEASSETAGNPERPVGAEYAPENYAVSA